MRLYTEAELVALYGEIEPGRLCGRDTISWRELQSHNGPAHRLLHHAWVLMHEISAQHDVAPLPLYFFAPHADETLHDWVDRIADLLEAWFRVCLDSAHGSPSYRRRAARDAARALYVSSHRGRRVRAER